MSRSFAVTHTRPAKSRRKEGKKTRKYGRNKTKCETYARLQKHEKSHIRRLEKHLEMFPNDKQAREALDAFRIQLHRL